MKNTYELRDVRAVYYDDMWAWNESFHLSEYEASDDTVFSFIDAMNNERIFPDFNKVYIYEDCGVLELRDIETDEPYFAAIPLD